MKKVWSLLLMVLIVHNPQCCLFILVTEQIGRAHV